MSHSDKDVAHAFDVGDTVDVGDSFEWQITNRLVNVDTGEALYLVKSAHAGYVEILTEAEVND